MDKVKEKFLRFEIPVHSEKYDISGFVRDYGIGSQLFFTYEGKEIVLGIKRNPLLGETYEELGAQLIDSYIDNLASDSRQITLHYWHIFEREHHGKIYLVGNGIVTGHDKIEDSRDMYTSAIKAVHTDFDKGELLVTTQNNIYQCPLEYCVWKKQDKFPSLIPEYEKVKTEYKDKIFYPQIEPGKVLLVLADFCHYYFHSVCFIPKDSATKESLPYHGHSHIGTFQDSYLIYVENADIDLRYFPHYQNIEFYSEHTGDAPLYIENIGDVVLYARTSCGTLRLDPGERKMVSEENAETETPILPGGDLYPAGFIDFNN